MATADAVAGRQILILSSVEWDSAWQRHQIFASQWAAAGHQVFFVENTGFRAPGLRDARRLGRKIAGLTKGRPAAGTRPPENIRVINPIVLPPTAGAMRRINNSILVPRLSAELSKRGLRPGCIAIAYLPTATTLALLDQTKPEVTIYDCVDNFRGHPHPPKDLVETEKALMRRSSLMITTSSTLREDKAGLHHNILQFHHGVSSDFFLPPSPRPSFQRLCYFGTLRREIDYAPISALADAGFQVELIGPARESPPPMPPGVTVRPALPPEQLPEALAACDALLLPYVDSEYNRGIFPAKIYECLATGRPVLSSPLPSLRDISEHLYICRTPEEWVRSAQGLARTETEERRAARVSLARTHTHEKAFSKLRQAISDCLAAPHGRI